VALWIIANIEYFSLEERPGDMTARAERIPARSENRCALDGC